MPSYRIYRVESGGRLMLGETFTAASDAEAIEQAGVLMRKDGAGELWSGGRLVGRFSKLGEFTPGVG